MHMTNVNERWEQGIPHNPRSEQIFKILREADRLYGNDHFCWKCGGDGDNGEILMYSLDCYFQDLKQNTELFMKANFSTEAATFKAISKTDISGIYRIAYTVDCNTRPLELHISVYTNEIMPLPLTEVMVSGMIRSVRDNCIIFECLTLNDTIRLEAVPDA